VINNINCYFDESGVLRTDWSDLGSFVDTSSAVYTYEDMVGDVNALKEQYPSLVEVQTLAVTADGRSVLDVVIGTGSKQIVVHGGCHAREYMGSMLVMNQTENLLKHYWDGSYSGRSYKDLLEDHQIHIIPMLNPDGITISQKGLDGIRSAELKAGIQEIYNKDLAGGVTSLGLSSYLRVWKANAKGVDINRNFPVPEWSYQDGIIGRPSCAKYNGPSAGSETETKAVTDLVNSLSGCRAVISYHSTGPEIYWQYHQSGDFLDQCRNTANALSNITGYRLLYGQNSGGGCSNWVADVKKIFACTIEIGSGSSPVDLGQYSGIWNSNKDVIPYILSAY
jgi:g-D-glutamyl-meso-diaminopimelate peptidase